MCNCRRRNCCCLNNMQNSDEYETLYNNIPSYDDDNGNSCSCGFDDVDDGFPTNPMYAQSYVPIQIMNNTFMPCSGLDNGTIFPELVSPYHPCQSMAELKYIADMNTIKEGCNR